MNMFGSGSAGDGSGTILRNIFLAGALITARALIAVSSLDSAVKDGSLGRIAKWGSTDEDLRKRTAAMPRPDSGPGRVIGVRYGNVDYTTTASIRGGKSKFNNVVADPSLGMPQ